MYPGSSVPLTTDACPQLLACVTRETPALGSVSSDGADSPLKRLLALFPSPSA